MAKTRLKRTLESLEPNIIAKRNKLNVTGEEAALSTNEVETGEDTDQTSGGSQYDGEALPKPRMTEDGRFGCPVEGCTSTCGTI